jgi:hypothetical protein
LKFTAAAGAARQDAGLQRHFAAYEGIDGEPFVSASADAGRFLNRSSD